MTMLYVESPNRTVVDQPPRPIDVIVVHTMEAAEKGSTAEAVANYFARPTTRASAHYCIDADSIVQCVKDKDVAWAAPGCNRNGLQLEHAGYAAQTGQQWDDLYSRAMLQRSAQLAAGLCTRYRIPTVWLSPADLKIGKRGITSHANVTAAFRLSTHTDPGPNFPAAKYVLDVRGYQVQPVPWPVPLPAWFWEWAAWRLGEGVFRQYGPKGGPRPPSAPLFIPPWAWLRLRALLAARKEG